MDKNIKEITDILNHIVANMVTKDELLQLDGKVESLRSEMHEGFASVRAEIREIRLEIRNIDKRLDAIEQELENHRGYAKDIDHVLDRLGAVEKHIGIKPKMAA